MSRTSNDIAKLINDSGSELGLDAESSSTIIGNLGGSVAPMCTFHPLDEDEQDSDDHRLVLFDFDGSGSMQDVVDELVASVNGLIVPSLCEEVLDAGLVGGIRVGGIAFSDRVKNLWSGNVLPVKSLPRLTRSEYYSGGSTSLHQSALDLVTVATAQSLQMSQVTGSYPEVTLVILSDGANNQPPMDPSDIYDVYSKLDPEIFTTVFLGFETSWGSDDFEAIARGMGIREVMSIRAKQGESPEDQRKRFRNAMGVFSNRMIARVSSSTVGIQAGVGGSTGFWAD